jgi:hypothetical protein
VRGCGVLGERVPVVRSTLAGVAMAVVSLVCVASADSTRCAAETCLHSGVAAVVNHTSVCLISGIRCRVALQRQYERHGFYCYSGFLARQHRTPPATVPTSTVGAPTTPVSPPGTVDFTVKTAGDPSFIVAAPYPIPGCSSASVTDLSNDKNLGPGTRAEFSGVKEFTCSGGGMIDIQYDVTWTVCSPSNHGTWQIVGGTGTYNALSGQGQLVGTYYPGPCLDPSNSGGIYDRYTGTITSG